MPSVRYAFAIFLNLCMFSANAQVSLGLRGGLAFSNVAFKQVEGPALSELDLSTQSRAGLTGSLVMDIPLSGHFSLMPELGYLQRGFKQQAPPHTTYRPGALNTVLDYFEGSLLGRFHIGRGTVQPHFLAGVTFGYLLEVRQYFQPTQGEKGDDVTSDPDDLDMNKWNLGLCGGAGLTFKTGAGLMFVEGRYGYGLSGLWNHLQLVDLNGNVLGRLNSFDRTFEATIGWVFPLGKRGKAKGTNAAPATK